MTNDEPIDASIMPQTRRSSPLVSRSPSGWATSRCSLWPSSWKNLWSSANRWARTRHNRSFPQFASRVQRQMHAGKDRPYCCT